MFGFRSQVSSVVRGHEEACTSVKPVPEGRPCQLKAKAQPRCSVKKCDRPDVGLCHICGARRCYEHSESCYRGFHCYSFRKAVPTQTAINLCRLECQAVEPNDAEEGGDEEHEVDEEEDPADGPITDVLDNVLGLSLGCRIIFSPWSCSIWTLLLFEATATGPAFIRGDRELALAAS